MYTMRKRLFTIRLKKTNNKSTYVMQLPFFSSLLLFSYCIAYFFPPQEGFEALQPSNARRRNPNPNLPLRPLTAHHQPLLKPKFYN